MTKKLQPDRGDQPAPSTVVDGAVAWQPLDLAELWRYRELLYFFTWRDIKVRYKQTEFGVAWAVLPPLLTTGVFTVLFGLLFGKGQQPTAGKIPYVLSTFAAMLPWQLFAESVVRSSESLLEGRELITKVYFPRILLPLSAVLTGLVDFVIGLTPLAVLMAVYGVGPSWALLALPVAVVMAVVVSLAVSLWLSALSAIFRDFRYAQPLLVRLGFFVSPVVYATAKLQEKLPEWAVGLYSLNPMSGAIEGFRWTCFGVEPPGAMVLLPSLVMTAVLFVGGLRFFQRMEATMVDVI